MSSVAKKLPKPVQLAELITVPDMTAPELLAAIQLELNVTSLNSYLPGWNFFADRHGQSLGYGGKQYEVMTWQKQKSGSVTQADLRNLFKEQGFAGNIPALLTWVWRHAPVGFYATLPDSDDELFINHADADPLNTLFYHRAASNTRLYLMGVPFKCSPAETYLAFREVSASPA